MGLRGAGAQAGRQGAGLQPKHDLSPYWPLPGGDLPGGWIGGCSDHLGVERSLQLLRERVIDAWI